jgi:hypothetical protein
VLARVCGPLAGYAEGFRAELEWLGYTPLTAAVHVRLMAHLSRWLAREGRGASGLSPAVVDAYFAERRAVGYVGHVTGRALRPLIGYLRRLEVVADAAPVAPASPAERVLARYRDWQLTERGVDRGYGGSETCGWFARFCWIGRSRRMVIWSWNA